VLVATFTVLSLLAIRAGLTGLFLALMLISWFFKYCFVVLDAALAGRNELPVLSVEMLNPFDEHRPLAFGVLAAICVAGVVFAKVYVGAVTAVVLATLCGLLIPAGIAVLGITDNVLLAAWPPRLFETLRGLGWDYILLNLSMLVVAAIAYAPTGLDFPVWATIAALQLLFLMLFALIGTAVFEHRLEFGLDSITPEERLADRDRREHNQSRQRMIDHAYEYFRHQKPLQGWHEIETWLNTHAQDDDTLTEYHEVFEAACVWDDVRPGDRLANELIGKLLVKRQTGAALEVLERRLAANPRFKPVNGTRLAELAGLAGKTALRRQLEAKA